MQDFPFNNILHSYVVQILESLFRTMLPDQQEMPVPNPPWATTMTRNMADTDDIESPVSSEDVLSFLLDKCNLLEWIVTLTSTVPSSTDNLEVCWIVNLFPFTFSFFL